MSLIKPSQAPACWGQKYQDGEPECRQCDFIDTCRPAMINRVVSSSPPPQPQQQPLAVIRSYAPQSQPLAPPPTLRSPSAQVVPLPSKPFYMPPATALPTPTQSVPIKPAAPAQVQAPQQSTFFQSNTGFSLPNPKQPNPMAQWHRPGAQSPGYFFTQYPGEAVGTRLAKNAVLRALEAIFAELMQFFRHWTWPPAQA